MADCPRTQIRPTEYMLEKTTILIVDDESGPRESLRMILSPAHKVITVDSGAAALDVMRSTRVDLITIDLNMPGMKGEDLMRTIRDEYPSTEIIVITGFGSVRTAVDGLRFGICDYISKPFDVVEVSGAVSRALSRKQGRSSLVAFLEGIGSVLGKDRGSDEVLAELATRPDLRKQLASGAGAARATRPAREREVPKPEGRQPEAPDTTLEFLDVLAQALESRDGYLRKHAQRVGFYADLLAERLGVNEELREHIRISSFLHDIGKVGISDEDKQRAQLRTSLTSGEEEHPEIGARLVEPLGFEEAIAEAIRHHHAHWDGSGHPDGIAGEQIPLAARMIAVVDTFDKLTSDRPGAAPKSTAEALSRLQKGSGTQFDPAVVAAFVGMVESGALEAHAAAGDAR